VLGKRRPSRNILVHHLIAFIVSLKARHLVRSPAADGWNVKQKLIAPEVSVSAGLDSG
jgi:hypothetical protein